MTNATIQAMNRADHYKKLYASTLSALTMIQMELDNVESLEMLKADIEEILKRTYKEQRRIGEKI